MTGAQLASRTVTGVVAGMVAATAAATAVGFWLSYAGLHDFATRAGLRGLEGWAWPASVDLFIMAGEAGVTISALRRRKDSAAWVYLAAGFAASVTANVLHVDPGALAWIRYAVAAVPPVAAMAALAAVLRQVYQLAGRQAPAGPEAVRVPVSRKRARGAATPAGPVPVDSAALNGHGTEAAELFAADLAAGHVPGIRVIRTRMHVGQDKARQVQAHLRARLVPADT